MGLANSAAPTSSAHWTWVTVDATEGGYSHLINYDGRLLVAYSRQDDHFNDTTVKTARALTAAPIISGDWQIDYVHETVIYGAYPQLIDLSPWNPPGLVGCFFDEFYEQEMISARWAGPF